MYLPMVYNYLESIKHMCLHLSAKKLLLYSTYAYKYFCMNVCMYLYMY